MNRSEKMFEVREVPYVCCFIKVQSKSWWVEGTPTVQPGDNNTKYLESCQEKPESVSEPCKNAQDCPGIIAQLHWLTLSVWDLLDSPVGMIINLDNSYLLYQPGPFYPDFSAENFTVKT